MIWWSDVVASDVSGIQWGEFPAWPSGRAGTTRPGLVVKHPTTRPGHKATYQYGKRFYYEDALLLNLAEQLSRIIFQAKWSCPILQLSTGDEITSRSTNSTFITVTQRNSATVKWRRNLFQLRRVFFTIILFIILINWLQDKYATSLEQFYS